MWIDDGVLSVEINTEMHCKYRDPKETCLHGGKISGRQEEVNLQKKSSD